MKNRVPNQLSLAPEAKETYALCYLPIKLAERLKPVRLTAQFPDHWLKTCMCSKWSSIMRSWNNFIHFLFILAAEHYSLPYNDAYSPTKEENEMSKWADSYHYW